MEKDKTELVASIKDAAHAGYAQGFQEGYQLKWWPKHGGKSPTLMTWTAL